MVQVIFFDYRRGVSNRFAIIFEQETKEDVERYRDTEEQFNNKWGWYGVIYNLANGELTKMNDVLKLTAEEVFTFLCYSKDLNSIKR